ncbi:hypothetical protein TNCV_2131211 [Trichonephila clavipes]|nr:hypothetical protein TNCV_2131211 [Trichonephila clavipes]
MSALMLVSCHLCDVITWWEQKLSALKIVLSGRLRIAVLRREVVGYKFVNGSVNLHPVKCLLDIQKDSTSGPAPLETRGNFFRESE